MQIRLVDTIVAWAVLLNNAFSVPMAKILDKLVHRALHEWCLRETEAASLATDGTDWLNERPSPRPVRLSKLLSDTALYEKILLCHCRLRNSSCLSLFEKPVSPGCYLTSGKRPDNSFTQVAQHSGKSLDTCRSRGCHSAKDSWKFIKVFPNNTIQP